MLDDEWSGEGSTRIEDDPTPSVLSRFPALYWTAEYKERVTIKHVYSNTQYVTVSNTKTPFTPGAETTGWGNSIFSQTEVGLSPETET